MWKSDESVKASAAPRPDAAPSREPSETLESRGAARIGKSVVIKGDLIASEDLLIEGSVEGRIELTKNVLTIGADGRIKAEILAKSVIVLGQVVGNITVTDRADIRDEGALDGNLSAPRISIADGAHFRGSIDMQRPKTP